jgi:hypothetical protein
MSTSTSRLSYVDCYELMDRALDDPRGVRLKFEKEGDARYFRMRLHYARKIDREDNKSVYERDHPMWGISQYDRLCSRIRREREDWYLYLEHSNVGWVEIEDLGEAPKPNPVQSPMPDELDEIVNAIPRPALRRI